MMLLGSICSKAQSLSSPPKNWLPIVVGQPLFFKNDSSMIFGIEVRSQKTEGQQVVYRFNNSAPDDFDRKFDLGLDSVPVYTKDIYKPTLLGAEMLVDTLLGDVVLRDTVQGIQFLLKPGAPLGTEWTFDATHLTKAKISKVYIDTVLDKVDSMKRIELSTGKVIVLSKNHGVVATPNLFPRNANHVLNYEQTVDKRFKIWQFNEWSVGDVLHTHQYRSDFEGKTKCWDSITYKLYSTDSSMATYTVKHTRQNKHGKISRETRIWHGFNRDTFFQKGLPGEIYFDRDVTRTTNRPIAYHFYDTTERFGGQPYYHLVSSSYTAFHYNIYIPSVASLFYRQQPNPHNDANSPAETYTRLAFYKSARHGTWGKRLTHDLNVSAGAPMSTSGIALFPNPANHTLRIAGLNAPEPVVITDLAGRVHFSGSIMDEVDVSGLDNGLYVLSLSNGTSKLFSVEH